MNGTIDSATIEARGVPVEGEYLHALVEVWRLRVIELDLNHLTVDRLTGFPDGYAGKLLGRLKKPSWRSAAVMNQALGLDWPLPVPNAEATERLKKHRYYEHRKFMLSAQEHTPIKLTFSKKHYRRIGKLGGNARKKKLSVAALRRIARKANVIRWERVKAAVRARDSTAKA